MYWFRNRSIIEVVERYETEDIINTSRNIEIVNIVGTNSMTKKYDVVNLTKPGI